MDVEEEVEQVEQVEHLDSAGLQSAGSSEDEEEDKPKSRVPEFLGLSRCAACYNHKATMARFRGDGESSSSAEDSGPEPDWDSEAESSSSSSSFSEQDSSEKTSEVSAAETEGDGPEETLERTCLVKSSSLTPEALLPRPRSITSTLHLQVLTQNHHDDDDSIFIVERHDEEETEGVGSSKPPQQPQTWLPWQPSSLQQHQLLYQHQQLQHFSALFAQGQRLPPPLHTLVPHTLVPHTHLPPPRPMLCWCCYAPRYPNMY